MDVRDCKISILTKMWRRGLFGGKYEPIEQITSGIPDEQNKLVNDAFDELHQGGYIRYHKGEACASINTSYKSEVKEFLRGNVPDIIINLH